MFSDFLCDIMPEFEENIARYNDNIGHKIYPKADVIKMLKMIIYLRMKSDHTKYKHLQMKFLWKMCYWKLKNSIDVL